MYRELGTGIEADTYMTINNKGKATHIINCKLKSFYQNSGQNIPPQTNTEIRGNRKQIIPPTYFTYRRASKNPGPLCLII